MSRFEDPERIKKIEGYKPNGSGINPNNGKLWKNTDCCSPRECCEERGDTLNSAAGNDFDGEPDCFMSAHIAVEYIE